MSEYGLQDCRVLIVEDEYILAEELTKALTALGAVVVGPVGTLQDAINIISGEKDIDGAILDANLRGEMVYPAADLLTQRGVRFVFTSGYDPAKFPARFGHIITCEKPIDMKSVVAAIGREMSGKA